MVVDLLIFDTYATVTSNGLDRPIDKSDSKKGNVLKVFYSMLCFNTTGYETKEFVLISFAKI